MAHWTFDDIPSQTGRVAIVTGANAGIGYETARALCQKGAAVVLACRNAAKGEDAVRRITAEGPTGTATLMALDLSDLDSIAAFAEAFRADHQRLDLLVDNAGVMMCPASTTRQGFELQMGTNHLGHFALTGRLLPLLLDTPGARVVVVSSGAHRGFGLDLTDLDFTRRRYNATLAYCASKRANLLFVHELQRRLVEAGSEVRVTAAHPGWTQTDLQRHTLSARILNPVMGMKPPQGALPTLRAATDPQAGPASYWGPHGFQEMRGYPVPAYVHPKAKDPVTARQLWAISEERTGVAYPL